MAARKKTPKPVETTSETPEVDAPGDALSLAEPVVAEAVPPSGERIPSHLKAMPDNTFDRVY